MESISRGKSWARRAPGSRCPGTRPHAKGGGPAQRQPVDQVVERASQRALAALSHPQTSRTPPQTLAAPDGL